MDAAFARISTDDRHAQVICLSRMQVAERLFPNWSMRDDPKHTWLWTMKEVAGGALRQADRSALLSVFARVAIDAS